MTGRAVVAARTPYLAAAGSNTIGWAPVRFAYYAAAGSNTIGWAPVRFSKSDRARSTSSIG